MTTPYSIYWPAASTAALASAQICTENVPLVFANPLSSQNTFTGVVTLSANMPAGNLRNVSITGVTTGDFVVVGVDLIGNILTETIVGPDADTVYGVKYYASILSITPQFSTDNLITVGTGNAGSTYWYIADTSNKNAQYSMAYENCTGAVSLTPSYTLNYYNFVNGTIEYSSATTTPALQIFNIPVANANVIVSPSASTTLPLTGNTAMT